MIIPKPVYKMKTVVRMLVQCLDPQDNCNGCLYVRDKNCLRKLMTDSLYYLQQTLKKSEKGQK